MAKSPILRQDHLVPEKLPPLNIQGAFVRRTDLSGASLKRANLAGADARNALFRNVDFEGANLNGTNLGGADLTGARNLTLEQLRQAIVDETTVLPDYIDRHQLKAEN